MAESVLKCAGMSSNSSPHRPSPICIGSADGINQPCKHHQFAGEGIKPDPQRTPDGRRICANHKPVATPYSGDCADE